MKAALTAILMVFLAFLVFQIWSFSGQTAVAEKRLEGLRGELGQAAADNQGLKLDYDFYLNPANLEKELRARFNYRSLGEKLIIIVPPKNSSSSP